MDADLYGYKWLAIMSGIRCDNLSIVKPDAPGVVSGNMAKVALPMMLQMRWSG
jgi:hypothetical protein